MDIINIIEESNIISLGTYGNVIVDKPSSNIISAGAPGPRGPSGESTISGTAISISNLSANDLLSFNGNNWTNKPQDLLTEGGNF
jgi:hypothetical protein